MRNNHNMTITKVAKKLGVVPKTIMRWEKAGKISKAKRDWRGWRIYTPEQFKELQEFHDTLY